MNRVRKLRKTGSGGFKGILALSAIGTFMYFQNRIIPRYADDYPFSFIWDGKHHGNLAFGKQVYKRVKTCKDLLKSQVSHYMTWSGRTPAETLNQIFLMQEDKKAFDLANAAVFPLQVLLSIWIGRGRISIKDISPKLVKLLSLGYYISTPHFAMTTIWQTGATNYSWMGILQSVFLLPYTLSKDFCTKSLLCSKVKKWADVVIIPLGLMAGWSNESGGGLALLVSGIAAIRSHMKKEKNKWKVNGFLSACIGYGLLMLAPGNFRRLRIEKEYSDILSDEVRDKDTVSPDLMYTADMRWHYLKNGFLSTVLHLLPLELPAALYLLHDKGKEKETTDRLLALTAASLSVPSILMFSPEFPKRAAYPAVIYGLSAAAGALEHLDTESMNKKYGTWIRVGKKAIIPAVMFNILAMTVNNADWSWQMKRAERAMKESSGTDEVIVPQTVISDFWSCFAGDRAVDKNSHLIGRYEENSDDPYNKAAAAYYGVKRLRTTSGKEHPYKQGGKEGLKARIFLPFVRLLKQIREIL